MSFRDFFKNLKLYRQDIKQAGSAKRFLGVNLEKNYYLGKTRISFDDVKFANVFFFCDKTDFTNRFYILKADNEMYQSAFANNHTWMIQAELWKACELDFYQCVMDTPSNFLKKYMLDNYKTKWVNDWWKKDYTTEGNIVNFPKKGIE